MNEFLREHKDLFTSKREFLTKLREVRQKFMNTMSTETPTSIEQQQSQTTPTNTLSSPLLQQQHTPVTTTITTTTTTTTTATTTDQKSGIGGEETLWARKLLFIWNQNTLIILNN